MGGAASLPSVPNRPPTALVRHLERIHGLVVGDATWAECDEAEGWISETDPHPTCVTMRVNGGSGKGGRVVAFRSN